jgi:O-antigen ligase
MSFLTGISILASLFLTVYSGSRGSVVALAAASLFFLFTHYPRWRRSVVCAGFFCISALLSVVYFGTLGNVITSWQRSADWTSDRLGMWQTILSRVYENVPLTGYGPNTFKYLQYGQVDNPHMLSPHNIYIESFYSFGFPGSCLLSIALLMLLFKERLHYVPGMFLSLGLTITILYLFRGLVDMGLCNTLYVGHLALALGFIHGSCHGEAQVLPNDR